MIEGNRAVFQAWHLGMLAIHCMRHSTLIKGGIQSAKTVQGQEMSQLHPPESS